MLTLRRIVPLSVALLLAVYSFSAAQDNASGGWISDRQIEQELLAASTALIDAGRVTETSQLADGLKTPTCDLDLPAKAADRDAAGHEARLDSAALYEQACESVVIVGSPYKCPRCTNWHVGGATGFFITADGVVVTNHHVASADDKHALVVMTRDGRVFPVIEALAGDDKADVAILRVDPTDHNGNKANFKPLELAAGSRVGQGVRVIHHADGRYYTLTEGMVSRRYVDAQHGNTRWLTITADYARGSSGGPLLDDAGRVIGMVASTHSVYYDTTENGTQQNLQMVWKQCVPVENIRGLIE